ncbi:hypothetical protein M3Y98_00155600 [Aphelenchoides besseyi]|nr:hypothetical protein M3Y98_00155600 [Aphelenchoides besseyi]KAI6199842.1 hypothetical protein M3Y96_00670000 [Aphelenchoides besseyi]
MRSVHSALVLLVGIASGVSCQSIFAGRYFATAPVSALSPALPPGPALAPPAGPCAAPPPPPPLVPVANPPILPAPIPVAPPPVAVPAVPVAAYAPIPSPLPVVAPAVPAAAPGVVPAFAPGCGPFGANKQERQEEAKTNDNEMTNNAPLTSKMQVDEPSTSAPTAGSEKLTVESVVVEAPKEMS